MNALLPCPFCGGLPEIRHIGNDCSQKRKITIRCPRCRIERTDATLSHPGFDWLDKVGAENWNQRPADKEMP